MGVAHTFSPATLSKNCSLLETDNVHRQISKHISDRRICCCTIEAFSDLPRKSSAIFGNFWRIFGNIFVSDRKSSVAGPCIILYVMLIEQHLYYMKTVSAKDKCCIYYLTNPRFTFVCLFVSTVPERVLLKIGRPIPFNVKRCTVCWNVLLFARISTKTKEEPEWAMSLFTEISVKRKSDMWWLPSRVRVNYSEAGILIFVSSIFCFLSTVGWNCHYSLYSPFCGRILIHFKPF